MMSLRPPEPGSLRGGPSVAMPVPPSRPVFNLDFSIFGRSGADGEPDPLDPEQPIDPTDPPDGKDPDPRDPGDSTGNGGSTDPKPGDGNNGPGDDPGDGQGGDLAVGFVHQRISADGGAGHVERVAIDRQGRIADLD